MKGVDAVQGVKAQDMGILTTPQLHWMVRAVNSGLPSLESDYFATLSQAFRYLFTMVLTAVSCHLGHSVVCAKFWSICQRRKLSVSNSFHFLGWGGWVEWSGLCLCRSHNVVFGPTTTGIDLR